VGAGSLEEGSSAQVAESHEAVQRRFEQVVVAGLSYPLPGAANVLPVELDRIGRRARSAGIKRHRLCGQYG
jgi:hypothetical protein